MDINDINSMSDEEIRALNVKLGNKVVTKYVTIFGLKWIVIIGLGALARHLVKSSYKIEVTEE